MKRLVTMCGLCAMTLFFVQTAYAKGEKAFFLLGPLGEIVYANGTPVQGDERYVVVFTAEGHEFAGFTADGHLKDSTTSVVSTYGNISEITERGVDGLQYELSPSSVQDDHLDILGCDDGVFELYLLDSRLPAGGYATIDEVETFLPEQINAWSKLTESGSVKASELKYARNPTESSGSLTTTKKTVIGSATPVPILVSMVYTNGVATVEATNTVPTANYVLRGSLDLTFTNTTWTTSAKAGAGDTLTPLVISDPSAPESAAFYRIEVAK